MEKMIEQKSIITKNMKDINRVELQGTIGQDARINKVGDTSVARFMMAVNEYYRHPNGSQHVETTWFSIIAWHNKNMPDFEKLKKGAYIRIIGRFRQMRYTSNTGEEKSFYEVIASEVKNIYG